MARVSSDLSMSLDGFITGPNEGVGNPLGDDGGRLHDWMFDAKTDADAEVLEEVYATTGAILMGKRMFDVGVEPWGDPPPFRMPVFVLTHESREHLPMLGGTTYTFVTDGLEAGLEQARAATGAKNVGIWGGAHIIRQYLKAGLLDEVQIHLVPVLLGEGVRLFEDLGTERIELRRTGSILTASATHLRFDVVR
jgi:dihydrofolate reductase